MPEKLSSDDQLWSEGIAPQLDMLETTSSSNLLNGAMSKLNGSLKSQEASQLSPKQIQSLLTIVFNSYIRCPFNSKLSQQILQIFSDILVLDFDTYSKGLSKFVGRYSTKPSAAAVELTLLKWITYLSGEFAKNGDIGEVCNQLVPSSIRLFDHVSQRVAELDTEDHHKLRSVRSAATEVKSLYIAVLRLHPENIQLLVSSICDSKLPIDGIVGHIGQISAAALELKSSLNSPVPYEDLSKEAMNITKFFVNNCLGLKASLTGNALHLFETFISQFVGPQEFTEILIGLQKCASRNSELTFNKVSPSVFKATDASKFDVVDATTDSKFFSQLIAELKSSKQTTRSGAATSLKWLVSKFIGGSSSKEDSLKRVLDDLFKVQRSLSSTSTEQKVFIAQILASVPKTSQIINEQIIMGILATISRDGHEVSLSAALQTVFDLFVYMLLNGSATAAVVQKLLEATRTGLTEKKQNLRACWATSIARALQNNCELLSQDKVSRLAEFLDEKILSLVVSVLEDCTKSPLASTTNKLISGGYASIVILTFVSENFHDSRLVEIASNADIVKNALQEVGNRPSILTDLKVIEKLSVEDTQKWFISALYSVAPYLEEVSVAFGYAALYSCTSRSILNQGHILSSTALHKSIVKNQRFVLGSCIAAVNSFIRTPPSQSSELKLDPHYLHAFLSSITRSFDGRQKELFEASLVDLIVAGYHKAFGVVANRWVGVCQAAGVDPGYLVSTYADTIVHILAEILVEDTSLTVACGVYDAACQAIASTSFISPSSIVPKLVEIVGNDLNIVSTLQVDDEKLAVWKGSEGSLVVNVLEKNKKKASLSKNSKDYETLKWEQEVRQELEAKKKTSNTKLTKAEKELIDKQLNYESQIRHSVNTSYLHLRRGLEIIIALSNEAAEVENDARVWFPVAVVKILNLLNSEDSKKLVGDLATRCFLTMSDVLTVTGLTGTSCMKWIGASTLRLYNIESIPSLYTSANLTELVSSQLFSLKISSEKGQFSSLTLMYILPLLVKVVENGKKYVMKYHKQNQVHIEEDYVDESPEEEQLALALSIVSSNSEGFEDETIPRTALLRDLIDLMAVPSKAKLAKDCFVPLAQSISVNIASDDLDILLRACIDPSPFVRTNILEELDQEFDLSEMAFDEEIWISRFDAEAGNREIANTIWEESNFKLDETVPDKLLQFLGNKSNPIRLSVAEALAEATISLKRHELFSRLLDSLLQLYREKAKPPAPKTTEFGLVIKAEAPVDTWEERSGVALTLKFLSPLLTEPSLVEKVFRFLVDEKAVTDKNEEVRQELQDAGMTIINKHGKANVESLISIFEAGLASKDGNAESQDRLKQSVIILYGNLAHHLDVDDSRVENIVSRLLKALDTPSEDVQFAVSECIAPLVSFTRSELPAYFDQLFDRLFEGKSLAERRGAAYGLAGLVKGEGLSSVANYDVIRNLEDASDDKADAKKREGVMFAVECLSRSLSSKFEPYVLELLPIVLKCFGDSSAEVRDATEYAAKEIMKNTTSYGIEKLIPMAIENLDDISWRAKKGSVQLLGSMAYLDPAQLSSSLPTIVPEIVGVLNDSHKEVRKAADKALKNFGEVIRNPEIQKLVPTLLKAIGDPTNYTDIALDGLISTQFVHYIDGPSMALIIHVIDRGMHDRSASTKKKASQIVGNMSILVDAKDLLPYLPKLITELQESIVDPVPQTRATAARALGTLVERLGEERFPDLIPKLMATLQDETRPGDRMGSAQALAEVIRGLGIPKLDELLPTILAGTTSSKAHVRAGFLPMLLFLPVCFGNQFAPYLSKTIPPILNGLTDTDDDIRDVSLRAGRLIVSNYANKAIDLLLPELEKGMSDDNPRIRLSSVELTGDLLFKISGISGNLALSEDITILANVTKTFNEVLGEDRRNQVLSALFVCRSDISGAVRIGASNIWKSLVANTPKTIKEILPTLTQIIVRRLASPEREQRTIAATALGDMVKRVGGNALSQLLPTLEESLVSSDSDAKQGICIALRELIESSAPDAIGEHQATLVRIIRSALTDANPSVREAAAQAFDALQNSIGSSAVDEVIPQLLEKLDSDDQSEDALSALQEIMSKKSDVIFPILIPALLKPPINAKALGSLAQVAGNALFRKLSVIISALINAILKGEGDRQELVSALSGITLSVDTDEGCHPLMQEILSSMRSEDHERAAIIYEVLPEFFAKSTLDYSAYTQDLVTQLIFTLDDKDQVVAKNSFDALSALISRLPKDQLGQLVAPVEQTLSLIGNNEEDMYVFSLPKGPNCLLPVFLHGLMYGDDRQREQSANGISFIVKHTPAAGLRPYVTSIVGPLIRVIGERFSGDVKSAILLSLNKLFAKIPQFLRPFIPQLQRTFIKSLSDTSNELLRTRAAKALGTLIKYQPRVDPLVTELLTGAKAVGSENIDIQTSILKALLEVVDKAGDKISERGKNGIMTLVESEVFKEDAGEDTVASYARLIGSLSKILSKEEAVSMFRTKVLQADMDNSNSARFAVLVLNAFLKDSPENIFDSGLLPEICSFIVGACKSKMPYVSDNATIASGKLLLSLRNSDAAEDYASDLNNVIEQLCVCIQKPNSASMDTRRLALVVIRTVCRFRYDSTIKPYMDLFIPSVFACVRDPVIPIKLAAEKCFLAVLNLVNDESNEIFKSWLESREGETSVKSAAGTVLQVRSISEYVKRVATRLASVERERISAGGDMEAMFSDQFEDEREIWAIGGVDLSKE
ncbi:DEKNAAC102327 [Brettanomyces naardenensis]|uniref:DEKNAAC102327 n=1 Tax=Brettanomyces naardenensis TaxID=13370 RepID=A0A448YKP4_BRENA|nr:DEKNAAC102327 [Brettanomyces naardenensis]